MMAAGPDTPAALSDEEAMLWRATRDTNSLDARQKLFAAYLPFSRQIAARHHRERRGSDVELQDLRQLACAGLLEAIDRFEPDRGVPFRSYAARRISGSILNGIAKMSEVREQIATRNRLRQERLRSLSLDGAQTASSADPMRALAELAVGLAIGFMLEDSALLAGEDQPDRRPNAYESLAWKDLLRRLHVEIDSLPDRERLILRGHYLDGVPFEQLGALLGISKGRVSQLHKAAIVRIRKSLQAPDQFALQR